VRNPYIIGNVDERGEIAIGVEDGDIVLRVMTTPSEGGWFRFKTWGGARVALEDLLDFVTAQHKKEER
jgi:hypothetical protein